MAYTINDDDITITDLLLIAERMLKRLGRMQPVFRSVIEVEGWMTVQERSIASLIDAIRQDGVGFSAQMAASGHLAEILRRCGHRLDELEQRREWQRHLALQPATAGQLAGLEAAFAKPRRH